MLGYCPVAEVRGKGKTAPSRRKEPSLAEPDGSGCRSRSSELFARAERWIRIFSIEARDEGRSLRYGQVEATLRLEVLASATPGKSTRVSQAY